MRAVVQRSQAASVSVDGQVVGAIEFGFVVLVGVEVGDTSADVSYLANKLLGLRIFNDDQGKMNRDIIQVGGQMLLISQFTLCGDARQGRRPSFIAAAPPDLGRQWFDRLVTTVAGQGVAVATGEFGADMQVQLLNDGPVTILLDSKKLF